MPLKDASEYFKGTLGERAKLWKASAAFDKATAHFMEAWKCWDASQMNPQTYIQKAIADFMKASKCQDADKMDWQTYTRKAEGYGYILGYKAAELMPFDFELLENLVRNHTMHMPLKTESIGGTHTPLIYMQIGFEQGIKDAEIKAKKQKSPQADDMLQHVREIEEKSHRAFDLKTYK